MTSKRKRKRKKVISALPDAKRLGKKSEKFFPPSKFRMTDFFPSIRYILRTASLTEMLRKIRAYNYYNEDIFIIANLKYLFVIIFLSVFLRPLCFTTLPITSTNNLRPSYFLILRYKIHYFPRTGWLNTRYEFN